MGDTTVQNWARVVWAIVVTGGLLAGGCKAPSRSMTVAAGQCVGAALQVRWPPGRLTDLKFATINDAGFENAKHYCIGFEENEQSGEYHVLCGIEHVGDAGAKFYMTPKNQTDGQPPKPGPRGPGMRHNVGWSFITFRWPLIWVRNIDAGSIGTTAIMRWEDVDNVPHLSLYLVRNEKPIPAGGTTSQPVVNSCLFLRAGYPYESFQMPVPGGKEIVRVRFYEENGVSNRMVPIESSPGVWERVSFDVTTDGSGAIVVTATEPAGDVDCAFLAGVLQRAKEVQIYQRPGEPAS